MTSNFIALFTLLWHFSGWEGNYVSTSQFIAYRWAKILTLLRIQCDWVGNVCQDGLVGPLAAVNRLWSLAQCTIWTVMWKCQEALIRVIWYWYINLFMSLLYNSKEWHSFLELLGLKEFKNSVPLCPQVWVLIESDLIMGTPCPSQRG